MSDVKERFYWICKPDGSKTIVEYDESKWYLLGSELEHDYLPDAWKILGEVANVENKEQNKALHLRGVSTRLVCSKCGKPKNMANDTLDMLCECDSSGY